MAAGDGLISMTPTSIAHSGTSASVNADGGVDFSAVTSLSLNGVFTSDYDNYLIVMTFSATIEQYLATRLRASGSDATGSNYVTQVLSAQSTSATGSRTSATTAARIGYYYSGSTADALHLHVYAPALAQPTAQRSVTVLGRSGAAIYDNAATHSLSTSYDGITFLGVDDGLGTGGWSGNIHVFGYEE